MPYISWQIHICHIFHEQRQCWEAKQPRHPIGQRAEGRCDATWKREFGLPWREAGPPNHNDDKMKSDHQAVNKECSFLHTLFLMKGVADAVVLAADPESLRARFRVRRSHCALGLPSHSSYISKDCQSKKLRQRSPLRSMIFTSNIQKSCS